MARDCDYILQFHPLCGIFPFIMLLHYPKFEQMTKLMFRTICIFVLTISSFSFGQNIKKFTPTIIDSISYVKSQNPDKAIEFAFGYLKTHPVVRPSNIFTTIYHTLGTIFLEKGLTNQALEYILTSKSFMDENDITPWVEINLGNVYSKIEDWENAKKQYEIALKIFSRDKVVRGQATALNMLGMIEHENKHFKAALSYYDEAMRIRIKSKSRLALMHQCIQYGQLYNDMDKIDLALQMFERADSLALAIEMSPYKEIDPNTTLRKLQGENSVYKGISLVKRGSIKKALQQFSSAEKYLIHHSELYTFLIRKKTDTFLQIGQSDSAQVFIQNAFKINNPESNQDQYIALLEIQRGVFSYLKDFQSIIAVDSMLLFQKESKLKQLNMDLKNSLFLKSELAQSRRILEKKKDLYTTIIGSLVAMVIMLGLLIFNSRIRKIANQQAVLISTQLKNIAESNLRLKEIELTKLSTYIVEKNDLITSFSNDLDSQINNIHNDQYKKGFQDLQSRLNAQMDHSADWDRFQTQFSAIYPAFINQLKQKYPHLTQGDLKVCCYLIMNQSTKDIAQLMSLSIRTIDNRRYRLKKKMNLLNETNLLDHLFLLSGK